MFNPLAEIIALITRVKRAPVSNFDWGIGNGSHLFKLFRVWELLFWRRDGIRPDGAGLPDGTQLSYSWENYIVHSEIVLKRFLKRQIPKFRIVYIPQLQLAGYRHMGVTPFRFAIAFDNATRQGGMGPTTSQTYAYTCTGSDRFLQELNETQSTTTITAVTYAAVSCTALDSYSITAGYSHGFNWYLAAPASGSNNFVVTISPSDFNNQMPISYTGVLQISPIDTHGVVGPNLAVTSLTLTTTIGTTNSWLSGVFRNQIGDWTVGAGTTFRIDNTALTWADSNGPLATGSQSLTATCSLTNVAGLYISFKPTAAVGPANVKSFDGVAQSTGIKTYWGNTVANTKTVDGIA